MKLPQYCGLNQYCFSDYFIFSPNTAQGILLNEICQVHKGKALQKNISPVTLHSALSLVQFC